MTETYTEKTQYQAFLDNQFSSIMNQCSDVTPQNPYLVDIVNRQQILFMQFEMEKKGKNFGISQWRLLKIENDSLFQVDKNSQEKPLPFPISIFITKEKTDAQEKDERYKHFQAKIQMKFAERSDITVYFRSAIQCNQIGMYLLSKIREGTKSTLQQLSSIFKESVISSVAKKIGFVKKQSNNFKNAKMKAKLLEHFKKNLNDRSQINTFFQNWKDKALFYRGEMTLKIDIKELHFKQGDIIGIFKIWLNRTVVKHYSINEKCISDKKQQKLGIILFKSALNAELASKSQSQVQIQLQINGSSWISQKFSCNDLRKMSFTRKNLEISLTNRGQIAFLRFSFSVNKIQPYQPQQSITPKHYRIIDDFYNPQGKRLQRSQIHSHYTQLLLQSRKNHYYYRSFNKFKQLTEILKINQLIQKFYSVSPFLQNSDKQSKGTFIYEYFLRHYEKQLYYEIQKIMWHNNEPKYKRILTALKVFDQNPKFNLTDAFFHLVKRMFQISSNQSEFYWKPQLFSHDTKGIQSMAFFLSIAIIKTFPSIFICQQFVNKRALPFNSLLFIYILKKQFPKLFSKFNVIELNIETLFGIHFVTLFTSLFQGQLYCRILLLILSQKCVENSQSMIIFTMIGAFLAAMTQVDSLNCAYLSAQHYKIAFQQTCKYRLSKSIFFSDLNKYTQLAKTISCEPFYQQLSNDITDFYLNNAYSGELGDISKQIYQQFTSYHYKNQADLRKILLFIDKIQLGNELMSHRLTLTIFQSASKLYQHQFKGVNLSHIDHFIEIKLVKLEEITIICNTDKNSYSCRIDPKEIPSNLYFHKVKPLILTYHLSPEQNRHIFFQVYIKDNAEIDCLQNPIPNKYREYFLQKDIKKEDLTFCKKFTKTFRMRQNNFNLLYTKLGWFGNHYLIPDDRLIQVDILGYKQGGSQKLLQQISIINKYTRSVFGKAFCPQLMNQSRNLSLQIIKDNVKANYDANYSTIKSSINQTNIYNSSSRLICYSLDNFNIPSSMQFLQFYYQMTNKLPLINYLSYHPKLFYLLPTFTIQVSNNVSACTIVFSEKGPAFINDFAIDQIADIQEKSMIFSKLPQQIQFSYANANLYFDEFLNLLRLNILKAVIKKGEIDKKVPKPKKWPNSLVSSCIYIPNYKIYSFYEVINQAKQIVQLQFKQMKRIRIKCTYSDFGLINDRWWNVHCISILKTSANTYFYVLGQQDRKKYILQESDFIQGNIKEQLKIVNLTDDISNSMQIITFELKQLFEN